MICVKESNDVDAQVALQPNDVGVSTVQNLQDLRICEDFIQAFQSTPPRFQSIDYPILATRADLHERDNADVRPVIVMLQVNRDLSGVLKFFNHLLERVFILDECGRCACKWEVGNRVRLGSYMRWIGVLFDLLLVRMFVV